MIKVSITYYTKAGDDGEDIEFRTLLEAIEHIEHQATGRNCRAWIDNREVDLSNGSITGFTKNQHDTLKRLGLRPVITNPQTDKDIEAATPKLCKDCKHSYTPKDGTELRCRAVREYRNFVTGEVSHYLCLTERSLYMINEDSCGAIGQKFEPKEPL